MAILRNAAPASGPGGAYIWPSQVRYLRTMALDIGLEIAKSSRAAYAAAPAAARWRVTLDCDGDGKYLGGVATCIDDRVRDVLVLEPVR